ncbi:MAG: trigger factor [Deltaproteobacteria bacterium]|nr:trigger factor [Deltaproteobacteria bacterium]
MQVQIDELSSVQKKIQFTLEPARIDAALDQAYRNLGKDVNMRGFRKGKVPRRILEQRFGRHIEGEVGGQLISEAFDEAIKEHEITPVSQPIVEQGTLKKGTEYSFSVTIEVRPELTIEGWEGMDIEWEAADVPDEMIEAELEGQRARHGTVEAAPEDYKAKAGDYVLVDATFTHDDLEDKTFESLMVMAGSPMGVPVADLLADDVVGLKPTQKKTFRKKFEIPEGALDDEWTGKKAKLKVVVSEIKFTKLPELDDDFAQDVGFDSLDALRVDAQFRLSQSRGDEARARAAGNAVKVLTESNDFDLPEGLVRAEGQAILDQNFQQMRAQGLQMPRMRLEQLPEETQEQVLEQARFSVRRSLLLEAIATQAEIEVTDSDVDDKISEIAEELGQQPAAVKGLLNKNHGMDELRSRLREDKAMDLLLERGNIVDVEWGHFDVAEEEAAEEPVQDEGGDAAESAPAE